MDNPKRSGVHNAANSRDGVKNTIVLISTISIVYMATMHSTICALDQGLEPKTIARGKNNTADRAQDKDNWTRGQT